MKNMPSGYSQEFDQTPEPIIPIEHFEQTHEKNPKEESNEAPSRSKTQMTEKSSSDDFFVYLVDDTLMTIWEAFLSLNVDYWKEAVRGEMDSGLANWTWDITNHPYGCKPIRCKWVFDKKLRPDGIIEKYKARLVAKGFIWYLLICVPIDHHSSTIIIGLKQREMNTKEGVQERKELDLQRTQESTS